MDSRHNTIFINFFNEVIQIYPQAHEYPDHLSTETNPRFHNLQDEDLLTVQTKAAYNLALAMAIALEEKSIRIFSPAPMTLSGTRLTETLMDLPAKLIEIILPVLELSLREIPNLTSMAFISGYTIKLKDLIDLLQIRQKLDLEKQDLTLCKSVLSEMKSDEREDAKDNSTALQMITKIIHQTINNIETLESSLSLTSAKKDIALFNSSKPRDKAIALLSTSLTSLKKEAKEMLLGPKLITFAEKTIKRPTLSLQ